MKNTMKKLSLVIAIGLSALIGAGTTLANDSTAISQHYAAMQNDDFKLDNIRFLSRDESKVYVEAVNFNMGQCGFNNGYREYSNFTDTINFSGNYRQQNCPLPNHSNFKMFFYGEYTIHYTHVPEVKRYTCTGTVGIGKTWLGKHNIQSTRDSCEQAPNKPRVDVCRDTPQKIMYISTSGCRKDGASEEEVSFK